MSHDGRPRVDPVDVPADGRVRGVVVDGRTVALDRCGPRRGALDNRCPHQGGPLGEGSIENGWLRCPWHGYDYDYDPISGQPPAGLSDGVTAYEVRERDDGGYVRLPQPARRFTAGDAALRRLAPREMLVLWPEHRGTAAVTPPASPGTRRAACRGPGRTGSPAAARRAR